MAEIFLEIRPLRTISLSFSGNPHAFEEHTQEMIHLLYYNSRNFRKTDPLGRNFVTFAL